MLPVLDQAKEPREGPGVGGIVLSNAEAGSEKDGRAALKCVNEMEEGERGGPWNLRGRIVSELGILIGSSNGDQDSKRTRPSWPPAMLSKKEQLH